MGKFSRDKGARKEREVVNTYRSKGYKAERVPLSGAAGGSFAGDILVYANVKTVPSIQTMTVEVKHRADGFKQIYNWLGDNDALVIGADRQPQLLVIPLEKALNKE